jgi:hypothetical protein
VHAPQADERLPLGDAENQSLGISERHVNSALRQQVAVVLARDVLDRLEPLGPQQFHGDP